MPIHDWTRVKPGIFHVLHHDWITEIARALNQGVLPADYYALPEQRVGQFGPDVLALHTSEPAASPPVSDGTGVAVAPRVQPTAETDLDFYRRKQNVVAVRHASDDRCVAVIELVSPGNKSSRRALANFVDKSAELLDRGIHLLVADLQPPGQRDPNGIHAELWDAIAGEPYELPRAQPLTFAAYETDDGVRAYVEHRAVGETLPVMPLFLAPQRAVDVPLESTYTAAYNGMAARWRQVLEAPGP
ncbi:MAG: DUF4058 family protein [Gemmataceae bacterium]|nr:DUF4058 family protein [Gemmataceae bacterium]